MTKKILITGVSGLIGSAIWNWLDNKNKYDLYGLSRRFGPSARIDPSALPEIEDDHQYLVDITNFDEVLEASSDKDVIVHMAADPSPDASWETILKDNIIGTYNVFEAARLNNVKRVIFASSGSTVNGFERIPPYDKIAAGNYTAVPPNYKLITHEMIRPDSIYGATKVWGEALGRYFSTEYGVSVLCVRIGNLRVENRPLFDLSLIHI